MSNLARERGDAPPAQPQRTSQPQPRPVAAAPAPEPAQEPEDERAPAPVADQQPTDAPDAPEAPQEPAEEGDDDGTPPELREAQAEIERLQKREAELTGDYTRKTQKLADAGRQLVKDGEVVRQTAQMLAGIIDQPVKQFEQVPWGQLQTQDPAKYQQLRGQFEQTVKARDNMMQFITQMEAQHDEAVERHRQQVADASRDILKTKISGWNGEVYSTLRDLAVSEFGYTKEEVDANIDHRFVELLHAVNQARTAKDKLVSVKRETQATKPGTPSKPAFRNESGQYQSARQNAFNRPGDKNAHRAMFQAKLAAERKR
jgi:hypothetical protein